MSAVAGNIVKDVRVVGLVSSGHFFSHFSMLVLPPLYPLLKDEFDVSYAALGALFSAFAIASGSFQLPSGFLVDRVGAKLPLVGGLALLAGGVALMGMSTTYWGLLGFALLAGLGNSVFHPANYTILSASVNHARLGRAYATHTFSGYLGWAAAPPVMILGTGLWGWRGALIAAGLFGLALALVMALQRHHLHDDVRPHRERPAANGSGSVALLLSLPIVLSFLFFISIAMASSGFQAFSVTALVHLRDLSLADANGALSVYLISGALGVLLGGVVADRTERYDAVAAIGFFAAAAMIALIAHLAMPVTAIVVVFCLAGLMQGSIAPSRDMIVRRLAPAGSRGKVFGFVSSGLDVGGAFAPVIMGWVVDRGAPEWVFWLAALFMMVSLVLAVSTAQFARREPRVA